MKSVLDMIIIRRHTKCFLHEIRRTLIAERIPQYKERSALLPGGLNTPFPIVVEPDIDLELLFKSHEQLQENLQRRHWIVDVKKVEHDYHLWKKLNKQIAEATARRSQLEELHQWGEQLYALNAKFLVACLRLPAPLHGAVPEITGRKLLYEYGSQRKSSLTMRSWRDLAEVTSLDAAPFSSFAFGEFAQLEYTLLNYFNKSLDAYNMQFCSTVNVVKSFVIEAFGYHFSDIKNVFNIVAEHDDDENSVELLHLFGTSTPLGIVSPFIRTNFTSDALPYYVYSIGRNYNPHSGQSSCIELLAFSNEHSQHLLVDDHQKAGDERAKTFEDILKKSITNCVNITHPKDINLMSNSVDFIYIQLATIITSFYQRLNVPLRVCLSPSYELLSYESLRLTIEVYLPSQIDYVRVGSVSLIDDYLARRLMIKHNSDNKSYVAMVHARVADVSQLAKCVLEASQTIGRGIKLPSVLSMR
ncbi:unnamed protein product [Rotaria magnacalcarata]|uniref:Uncharacterized protein n=1 Tax=Rotaria magnacalcarata TaxID=392030 RepID=A0A816SC20_9BILA|nr:unnamed protein product [Rotaria magnacalcarata]